MRSKLVVAIAAALLILPALFADTFGQMPSLEQILTRMDQQGATLRSMSTPLTQKKWTDILESFDDGETGHFYFLKEKDRIYLLKEIQKPQENILVIRDGKVTFYQPSLKQAIRHDLGRNKDKAEYLLLGFGSDKDALKEAYQIRMLGEEQIEGRNTYMLELSPKSQRVSSIFPRIVLWIDPQIWVPVQQKLVEPNGDYVLYTFHDVVLNPRLAMSRFDLKLPRDVVVVQP
jgi:outer membrane lipoprotein-sorting protein